MKYRGMPQASPFGDHYPREDVYINNTKVPIGNFMLATPRPSGVGKFLAPSHILYYVKEHNYLPPAKYVESVMSLNEGSDYTYSEVNPYYVVPKSDVNADLTAEKVATYPLYDRKNFQPHNREVKFWVRLPVESLQEESVRESVDVEAVQGAECPDWFRQRDHRFGPQDGFE